MSSHEDFDALLKKLEKLTPAEKRELKKKLLQPPDGSPPLVQILLNLKHHYRCKLCGRMWEEVHQISTNELELPEPILYLPRCFQCIPRILTTWERHATVELLVAMSEYGIDNVRRMFKKTASKPPKWELKWVPKEKDEPEEEEQE